MSNIKISEVISAYLGIKAVEAEARAKRDEAAKVSEAAQLEMRRRRANVVKLVTSGRLLKSDAADLLGITESGVTQMVNAYKANYSDML